MPLRSLGLFLALGLSFIGTEGRAQEKSPRLMDAKTIDGWLAETKVPAVGIGIIRDGVLREVRVFGELREGVPAPADAIFNVASLTKPIVTNLTLRLVSMGKWDLDEPLAKYWIDPDVAADPRAKLLTTRHILNHQTGFLNWRRMHASKKLAFEFDPGTRVQYSGEGFEYLRRALEKKFGKPLAQLSRELVLGPLRMTDTHHAWNEYVDESRYARWHDAQGVNTYTDDRLATVNAADDLLTTIADYGRFGVAVLNNDGLTAEVAAQVIAPRAKIKDRLYMGLGWEVHTELPGGEYALIHSGSDEGVKTLILLLPKSRQGLIIFTNGDNGFQIIEKVILASLDVGEEIMARAK